MESWDGDPPGQSMIMVSQRMTAIISGRKRTKPVMVA
jgi:hypothetical protein